MNKRIVLALAAGIAATAAVGASAATLGGITGSAVGADDSVVASCDTDGINAAYSTSYSETSGKYEVSGVTLSGVDAACNGQAYAVTLADSSNVAVSQATGTLAVSGGAASISVPAANAKNVARLSVIISG